MMYSYQERLIYSSHPYHYCLQASLNYFNWSLLLIWPAMTAENLKLALRHH